MRIALAIFVKTPGLSISKTRLRKTWGDELTDEFYLRCLKANLALVQKIQTRSLNKIDGYWAVAEDKGIQYNYWNSLGIILQGNGSLGQRLANVYQKLIIKYDTVCLMGADSPHLTEQNLHKQIHNFHVNKSDFFISKAFDGGFYLFGGKKEIPDQVWNSISYSNSTTATNLIKKLQSMGSISFGEDSFDLDTYEDLHLLQNIEYGQLLPEQISLLSWVKDNIV